MADSDVTGSGPDGKDINELSPEEQQALAVERSNASKEDFDPTAEGFEHKNKVVELADRASKFIHELVDHPDPVISSDAKSVVDGNFPGGPNYPNGPADEPAPAKKAAPAKETSAGTSSSNQ